MKLRNIAILIIALGVVSTCLVLSKNLNAQNGHEKHNHTENESNQHHSHVNSENTEHHHPNEASHDHNEEDNQSQHDAKEAVHYDDDHHEHDHQHEHAENTKSKSNKSKNNGLHSHPESEMLTLTNRAYKNIGIQTVEASLRPIEDVVVTTGSIRAIPRRAAIVMPRCSGIVKHLHFGLGDTVKRGDVLLELESIDLQARQIELITAVNHLNALAKQKTALKMASAEQIRFTLRNSQIDYLQSVANLHQREIVSQQIERLVKTKVNTELEKMRDSLLRADLSLSLAKTTLERTQALVQEQISASQDLIQQQAIYNQANNEMETIKHKFAVLGIEAQVCDKMIKDQNQTPISLLLGLELDSGWQQFSVLVEEASQLIQAKSAHRGAIAKVKASKQHLSNLGLTTELIESILPDSIATFEEVTDTQLLEENLALLAEPSQLIEVEATYRKAISTVDEMKHKLITLGMTASQLDKVIDSNQMIWNFQVVAPMSGQITQQQAMIGSTVEKKDPLYSIVNIDSVWIEGEVNQNALANIQIKNLVRARVESYPDQTFVSRIRQISPMMDISKRVVHFRVEVDNPNHQLKPGMFASLAIVTGQVDTVLTLPLAAVLQDGLYQFVLVEENKTVTVAESHYARHEIEIGRKDDQYVEIKSGLSVGDMVVVQGNYQMMKALNQSASVTDPHAGHSH